MSGTFIARARHSLESEWGVRRQGKTSHPLLSHLHMLFGLLHSSLFALVYYLFWRARVSFSRLQDSLSLFARPNVCLVDCTWWKSPLMRRQSDRRAWIAMAKFVSPETFAAFMPSALFTDPRTHGSFQHLFSAVPSSHFYWMRLLSIWHERITNCLKSGVTKFYEAKSSKDGVCML